MAAASVRPPDHASPDYDGHGTRTETGNWFVLDEGQRVMVDRDEIPGLEHRETRGTRPTTARASIDHDAGDDSHIRFSGLVV